MNKKEPERGSKMIQSRKAEHLKYTRDAQAGRSAGWEDVELLHVALPEVDFDEIDLSTTFLGYRLGAPLVISSMTGGHPDAYEINACLARTAQRYNLAMGLGSQRAALRAPSVAPTYEIARRESPDAFLMANIGAAQLIAQEGESPLSMAEIHSAIKMIRADALIVHLNFLEETIQPEGDRRARGCLDALANLVAELKGSIPVIAKETGAGISPNMAERLAQAGLAALDVGGRGGTSFAAVEGQRAGARRDVSRERLGELFRDWGVPTAVSVAVASHCGVPLIATGGVRSGLDAAKALSLGTTLVGVGRPLLEAALQGGDDAIAAWIDQFLLELRTAMFLTGSPNPAALRTVPKVIFGETREWLQDLSPAILDMDNERVGRPFSTVAEDRLRGS